MVFMGGAVITQPGLAPQKKTTCKTLHSSPVRQPWALDTREVGNGGGGGER